MFKHRLRARRRNKMVNVWKTIIVKQNKRLRVTRTINQISGGDFYTLRERVMWWNPIHWLLPRFFLEIESAMDRGRALVLFDKYSDFLKNKKTSLNCGNRKSK